MKEEIVRSTFWTMQQKKGIEDSQLSSTKYSIKQSRNTNIDKIEAHVTGIGRQLDKVEFDVMEATEEEIYQHLANSKTKCVHTSVPTVFQQRERERKRESERER